MRVDMDWEYLLVDFMRELYFMRELDFCLLLSMRRNGPIG